MTDTDVLIVGAGPAGASCAGELKRQNVDFILLDKQIFPRNKVCAGWITPDVFRALSLSPEDYPYGLKEFHVFVVHLKKRTYHLRVKQYVIRRLEFDRFLLEHNDLTSVLHEVRNIEKKNGYFIIDNRYRSKYLVGAGGSYDPVERVFFREDHFPGEDLQVAAIEEEFSYPVTDDHCRLWFMQEGLPGYAWYVPKADGYLNVGIGGYSSRMRKSGITIKQQWQRFTDLLVREGLVKNHVFHGKGYTYRTRRKQLSLQKGNVLVVGDAAGLATRDMGEGIGPAIESGMAAARAVATGKTLSARAVRRNSFSHWQVAGQLVRQRIFGK